MAANLPSPVRPAPSNLIHDDIAGSRVVGLLLVVLLCSATVLYLAQFPLTLGGLDEPKQLFEAKRLLGGEVMYRDIFDIILPGWLYLMAGLFWLFGTTLTTARMTAAVIHAVTVGLVFLACRRLAVRRELACAAALTYLVVCEPAYRVASNHWLATALCMLVLIIALLPQPTSRRAAVMGVVVGLITMVHQQRGAFIGIGVAACLVAAALLARWYRPVPVSVPLTQHVLAFAAGTLLVVVPLVGWLVLRAGIEPTWQAVVSFPLVNYRAAVRTTWGSGGAFSGTLPWLLALLPAVLAVTVPRVLALALRRADPERARALTVLTVFGLFSILSISYYPDFIHLAFIAPVFLVAVAEVSEWGLCRMPARVNRILGRGLALALAAAIAWRLERNLTVQPKSQPLLSYASAFGRVELNQSEINWLSNLDALLRDVPSRTLYVHPNAGFTYLLLGARNPTRFEFVVRNYTPVEALQEVVGNLAVERPRYVVTHEALIWKGDPIAEFIRAHYRPLDPSQRHLIVWRLQPE